MADKPIAITAGKSFRIYYGEGNVNNRTIHIRAIVDDQVVYRFWVRSKRRWQYEVESTYGLSLQIKHTIKRRKP